MTNYDMARKIAEFADVLAEYSHLPQLDIVTISTRRRVVVGAYDDPVRVLGQWASAFDRLVRVVPDWSQTLVAKVDIGVSGWALSFSERVPDEMPVGQMSAAQFLAALGDQTLGGAA